MSCSVGEVNIYKVALYDRYSMYADLITVTVNLLDYLKHDGFSTPEIKGIEQETTAALLAVMKCCAAALSNLEADTRIKSEVRKKIIGYDFTDDPEDD